MNSQIHKLGRLLASLVDDDFNYVQSRLALEKTLTEGCQSIVIDLHPTGEVGLFKFASHAHIRLNVLENQYGHFHPFLSIKERKSNPTVAINCDLLFSDKTLANSFEVHEDKLAEIAFKYADAIDCDVLPFFDKYFSVENLVASFEQTDPKLWVISDHNARNLVLLSAYALESKWDKFDQVSSEFLEYCEKPFAQAYLPLAQNVIKGLRN